MMNYVNNTTTMSAGFHCS